MHLLVCNKTPLNRGTSATPLCLSHEKESTHLTLLRGALFVFLFVLNAVTAANVHIFLFMSFLIFILIRFLLGSLPGARHFPLGNCSVFVWFLYFISRQTNT